MRKLFDNLQHSLSLNFATKTAAATGDTVIDTQGFSDGELVVVAGNITCTTGDEYRVKVFECDTSTGTFADSGIYVSFTGASGTLAGANTIKIARINELNVTRKRFLRVDLALTATTSSWAGAGVIVLGQKYSGAVNSD